MSVTLGTGRFVTIMLQEGAGIVVYLINFILNINYRKIKYESLFMA